MTNPDKTSRIRDFRFRISNFKYTNRKAASRLLPFVASALAVLALPFATLAKAAAPQPALCTVKFSIEPPSAQVFIDNAPISGLPGYEADGNGGWTVSLAPGDHVAEMRADGYDTAYCPIHAVPSSADGQVIVARSMRKTTGLALLKSEPSGAEVTIDGISRGTTPCMLTDLPLGTWQATFSLPGYRDTTMQFTLRDRAPVGVDALLPSSTVTIDVTADIDGVEVKVNGLPRGTAPCTVEKIPAGDIVLEASAPGYRDFVQMARAGESERLAIAVRMEPLPAGLSVYSLPEGARVYIDDAYAGATPLDMADLTPGEHRVRVEKEGFDPMARTVALKRGDTASEEFRLKANTGKIGVTSVPDGVVVYVDGVKSGETPPSGTKDLSGLLEIEGVGEGPHTLKFIKPGYFEKTDTCTIRRGATELRHVELKRQFVPDYEVVTETGSHKGVLHSILPDAIRIETRPGIVSTYPMDKVLSHGKLGAR